MRLKHFQRGVETVELAIIMPIYLFFFFGVCEFGFMLYDKAVITNASREAARAGVQLGNGTARLSVVQVSQVATNYTSNSALINLGSTTATPVVTVTPSPQTPVNTAFAQPLTVNISYDYTYVTVGSLLNLFTAGGFANPMTITATTTMIYE